MLRHRLGRRPERSWSEQPGDLRSVEPALGKDAPLDQQDRDSEIVKTQELGVRIDIALGHRNASLAQLARGVIAEMATLAADELHEHFAKGYDLDEWLRYRVGTCSLFPASIAGPSSRLSCSIWKTLVRTSAPG